MSDSTHDAVADLIENRPPSAAVLFLERVEAAPDAEAYRYPVPPPDGGPDEWRSLTWRQAAERVERIAAGLMDLGIRPQERVAIASDNRIEWILADLGVLCAGAATTTVYPGTNADESAYILADSGSRVLIAENAEQLGKARERRAGLPELAHVVVLDPPDGEAGGDDGWVLSLAELERRGAAYLAESPGVVQKAVDRLRADQLATLIYTSGTTGRPKGVRLRHGCWSFVARTMRAQGCVVADDVLYLWLPLSHMFGKVLLAAQLAVGYTIVIDGRVDRIAENLSAVRPTFLPGVPRIYEKFYNAIVGRARQAGGVRYRIFRWAAQVARDYARASQERMRLTGRAASVPFGLTLRHAVADRLVYAKIRDGLGGNLRVGLCGGAALSVDIGYFFCGAGIPIVQTYGLTEAGGANFGNHPDDYRTGTAGKPFPGTEVRIAGDGEILLRGPGVMEGYHGLPEQTAEILQPDGWLHTGDIGELSEDGYLKITDRKKDLFKTSGGKYVAPAEIESRFKAACPFVSNVLVYGAERAYCTALVALDGPAITAWAEQNGVVGGNYPEIVGSPQVRGLIDGYVRQLNGSLQRWQTVKRFAILPRDLDAAQGELTPSLKLRRSVVEREYAGLIEEMYAGTVEKA